MNKCDKVAFCLPNFGTIFDCINENCTSKYESIKGSLDRDNFDFLVYKTSVKPLLDSLDNKILKIWRHNEYFDQVCNYEKEIYLLTFDEDTLEIFKAIGDLSEWHYPNLPEDLYFFSNNKCYFASTSHESEYEIYDDSDEIVGLLSGLSFDFDIYSNGDAPNLIIRTY